MPGSNRPWLTAVRSTGLVRARDDPCALPWGPALAGARALAGVPEARPRGAVPVGVDIMPAAAPHEAQKCALAGTGCEQEGQGSVTGEC